MTAPWSGTAVDPQVADATVAAARTLEWIGHQVTEAGPAIDPEAVATAAMLSAVATGAAVLAVPHQPDPRLLEAVSRRILGEARDFRATDVMAALDAQNRVSRPAGLFFLDHDVLVTPTLAQLPAPHGTLDSDDARHTVRSWLDRLFEYGPFTAVWNVSGHPAISLPLGESREGLPIGVQLVAARCREDVLLRVAAELEQAMPWWNRQPSLFVA